MDVSDNDKTRRTAPLARQSYEAPALRAFGPLSQVTKGSVGGNMDTMAQGSMSM
jgi:hypothetical protein